MRNLPEQKEPKEGEEPTLQRLLSEERDANNGQAQLSNRIKKLGF